MVEDLTRYPDWRLQVANTPRALTIPVLLIVLASQIGKRAVAAAPAAGPA